MTYTEHGLALQAGFLCFDINAGFGVRVIDYDRPCWGSGMTDFANRFVVSFLFIFFALLIQKD